MLPCKSLSKKVQKGYFLQLLFDETSSSFFGIVGLRKGLARCFRIY